MYLFQELTEKIIGCAITVHRELGPGFLESIYEEAVAFELSRQKMSVEQQVPVNVTYQNRIVGLHRIDLIVEQKVIVELKAIKLIDDVHIATALSYLKATRLKVALILNFSQLTVGVKRVSKDKSFNNECAEILSSQKHFLKVDGVQFVPDNLVNNNPKVQGPDSYGQKSSVSDQQLGDL
jgi:GxxExxY protein